MLKASLNHFHINVSDMERSVRFYRDGLGLIEAFREGPDMVFLATPGRDVITLHKASPVGSAGLAHLGFRLDEGTLDEAIAAAKNAGGRFLSRGQHGPGVSYAYVADPDGYVIELSPAS